MLIGEHGHYPDNDLGQHLYPRRHLIEAAVAAMVGASRFVPNFSDKHLSWSYPHARWMHDTAARLGIPFLAGSSIGTCWRVPPVEWPLGSRVDEALGLGYGGVE